MAKIEISRTLIDRVIKERTKDVLDPAQEEQIKKEMNDLYDTITKKTKNFQRELMKGMLGDEIGVAISNKFFKENQEKIKESVKKIEDYAEEISKKDTEEKQEQTARVDKTAASPKIKRKKSRFSRLNKKRGYISDSDYTLEEIIEKETRDILDPEEAAKKESELRDLYTQATKKIKPVRTAFMQGLFGDEIGDALARTLGKEDPAEILKAKEFFKNYGKEKSSKQTAEESLSAVVRTPTFDSAVNAPSVGVEIQKKKTDRLSALIGADETFEVQVVEVLGDLLKSVGKLERSTKADEYGSVHEKLRWIIENCCDKCCDPLGGLPVPIPLPTRLPPRIPTRVPVPTQTRVPRTTTPAGALTPEQIAAYQRARARAGTALPAPASTTALPVGSRPGVASEPLKLTQQKPANFNESVLQPEKVAVPASQSRMEQMRRSAVEAEVVKPATESPKTPTTAEKYTARPGQQPVAETLNQAKDLLKEVKSTPATGELVPAKPTSTAPVSGELIPAQKPTTAPVTPKNQLTVVRQTSTVKSTPSIPKPGSAVGGIGGILGAVVGGTIVNSFRDKNLQVQDPKALKEQAEAAKAGKISEQETKDLQKQISAQQKDVKLRAGALGTSVTAGLVAAKYSPAFWTGFLKFMAVRSPGLYAKIGGRLAAGAAGLAIPGPGWFWTLVNVLGAAWAAIEVISLIKEYNALEDAQRISFEKADAAPPAAAPPAAAPPAAAPAKEETKPATTATTTTPPAAATTAPGTQGIAAGRMTAASPVKEEGFFSKAGKTLTSAATAVKTTVGGAISSITGGGSAPAASSSSGPKFRLGPAAAKRGKVDPAAGKNAALAAASKAGITGSHLAQFMAQLDHESGGFTSVEENLRYSAKRLLEIFPKYYKTEADAQKDEYQPQAIANRVYANRMGNGPPESGDGYRYRGRGLIQLTGKDNYKRFGQLAGVDLVSNPDMAGNLGTAADIAAAFYKKNVMDRGIAGEDTAKVTKAINGGSIGLSHRESLFASYMKDPNALKTGPEATPAAAGGPESEPSLAAQGQDVKVGGGGGGASPPAAAMLAGDTSGGVTGSGTIGGDIDAVASASTAEAMQAAEVGASPTSPSSQSLTSDKLDKGKENIIDSIKQDTSQILALLNQSSSSPSSAPNISPKQDSLGSMVTQESREQASNQIAMQAPTAPVVVNNNQSVGQQKPTESPKQPMPSASARSTENTFLRAISKDFTHPTSFTSSIVV